MDISGRDIVAVFGQGPVGASGTLSAKAMGARVIAICNVRDATIARESDDVLYTHAGPEIGEA